MQAFITQAAPDEAESAGALMLTSFQVAISAGAIIGGLLIDHIGSLGVFGFAGIIALAGTILVSLRKVVLAQAA
ncbi:hypothetical protein [Aestuariivirga litoralis]|uniref:hypothetical protein n=1 Tax=Aestuariivirga litoralis TaxID=2650924 RepID=UPI0018C84A50|nr:hypothetical protein [Aestuariivirga litoralis]MBG1231428.1 hypothetical protein [Aestuariivirga litoralis]